MDLQLIPTRLAGTVTPPESKSMAHRVLLASMLAGLPPAPPAPGDSQDIQATRRCIAALQASAPHTLPLLDCGESGSTLRFLIPIALALRGGGRFTGHGRLMERPQQPYFDLFEEKGIAFRQEAGVLTVEGRLTPGTYALSGQVSSQFVTGLLYALPLLDDPSDIQMTSPLESRGYVDMTLETLRQFHIQVENHRYEHFSVPGGQIYRGTPLPVEADWSQAAFWYAANFLENRVELQGLNPRSAQGDMVISQLYWTLARPGDTEIDIADCPDLLPPLAVMAAARHGVTRFTHAARLRMKESDRLSTVHRLLAALGIAAEEGHDSLTVYGSGQFTGGTVDGAGDHRIVMAAAIAATACTSPVTILGAEAVQKSYPGFWEEYKRLGGTVHVL